MYKRKKIHISDKKSKKHFFQIYLQYIIASYNKNNILKNIKCFARKILIHQYYK